MFGEIRDIIAGLTARETSTGDPWGGGTQQSDRLSAIADYCARRWPGDLLEIGCYTGSTTQLLARVARARGRRVLGVDPWADDPVIYEGFLGRMRDYADIIDVIRLPSQDERAIAQIKARSLCFAFVDGLHTHAGLLSDILAVGHCAGVIVVDDVGYVCEPEDLRPALWEGAQKLGRELYWHPKCREGYLLPC